LINLGSWSFPNPPNRVVALPQETPIKKAR
jgi:hypothetical protein